MIISSDFSQLVYRLKDLLVNGQIKEAKQINDQIWNSVPGILRTAQEQREALELVGWVALTIRESGQVEMALPWCKRVCDLAGKLEPRVEDTAWDYFHYASCLYEAGNIQKAKEQLDRAATVLVSSGAYNQNLATKMMILKSELGH